MKIERMYQDSPDEWEEVSEQVFPYWKKGTALQALKDAGQIRTPWAFYRLAQGVRA